MINDRLRAYCPKCKDWVRREGIHECQIKQFILIDEIMTGVADRLYAMEIDCTMVMWSVYEVGKGNGIFRYNLSIDLHDDLYVEFLGDLPFGWHYFRFEGDKISSLEFSDITLWDSYDEARAMVDVSVSEFERFLDSRDADGVRAVMRLLGG